jgi:hypothetical protein
VPAVQRQRQERRYVHHRHQLATQPHHAQQVLRHVGERVDGGLRHHLLHQQDVARVQLAADAEGDHLHPLVRGGALGEAGLAHTAAPGVADE